MPRHGDARVPNGGRRETDCTRLCGPVGVGGLRRDGRQCRVCGVQAFMPGSQSHHIIPFDAIFRRVVSEAERDGIDLATRAGLEALLGRVCRDVTYRSLSNGIQLCEVC